MSRVTRPHCLIVREGKVSLVEPIHDLAVCERGKPARSPSKCPGCIYFNLVDQLLCLYDPRVTLTLDGPEEGR